MPQGLPLVSIVTPSLNQGGFIEETILSIKNQAYSNIEHIIVDGGSTDNTLDIIKKYDGTYNMRWLSEPDEGQSAAINKGWRMAKGEIIAYINSDDTYMPWAVETAVTFFAEHPDTSMVYGDCNFIGEHGKLFRQYRPVEFDLKKFLCQGSIIPQPTVFLRKDILDNVGYLDTNLHMSMDADFWFRIGLRHKIQYIPTILAMFRLIPGTKSTSEGYKFSQDYLHILGKIFSDPTLPEELRRLERRAYGRAYFNACLACCRRRQIKLAYRHLVKSIVLYPMNLLKLLREAPLFAVYLLGIKSTSATQSVRNKD